MSSASRRWTLTFAAVQALGLTCKGLWPLGPTAGPYLWGTALLALLPGNLISAILVEKLLWSSRLSLTGMSLLEVPILLAINALLWFSLMRLIQRRRPAPMLRPQGSNRAPSSSSTPHALPRTCSVAFENAGLVACSAYLAPVPDRWSAHQLSIRPLPLTFLQKPRSELRQLIYRHALLSVHVEKSISRHPTALTRFNVLL